MDTPRARRAGLLDRWRLTALAVAFFGLVTSAVSTSLAIDAGEVPVTLLPWELVAPAGLVATVAIRSLGLLLLWIVVDRWRPRSLPHVLVGAGVFLLLPGCWQAWLMLART